MAIRTPICELLGIEHPMLLAPMAGVSGGALAAAVSRSGGLGLIGGGYGDADWLGREFDAAGDARVGAGFITWSLARHSNLLELALDRAPAALMLSFGDFRPSAVHPNADSNPNGHSRRVIATSRLNTACAYSVINRPEMSQMGLAISRSPETEPDKILRKRIYG